MVSPRLGGEKGCQTSEIWLTTLAQPSKRIARFDFFQPRSTINLVYDRSPIARMT
ncbi:hypothetical protein QUA11_28445 [Microcoleus sp. S13_D1]